MGTDGINALDSPSSFSSVQFGGATGHHCAFVVCFRTMSGGESLGDPAQATIGSLAPARSAS